MYRSTWNLEIDRGGRVHRRAFLRRLATTAAAGSLAVGWRDLVMARASELRKAGRAMILLWMDGGPSQFETFNPKPGSKFQGPAGAIPTSVPGVWFGEHWPHTSRVMDKMCLVRSMVSTEKDHDRAIKLVKTGYPVTPAVDYPTWGSVMSMEMGRADEELPAFVRIGRPRIATRDVTSGILGAKYSWFEIAEPGQLPPDVRPIIGNDVLRRRLALTDRLDAEFARAGGAAAVAEKRAVYERTARFVTSPKLRHFDLSREPPRLREAYGKSRFGQGCLLARRLVEAGVPFVEVFSSGTVNDQGWDTHKNGFAENPILAAETDSGYATLLADLAGRGLLDSTLVVWMGEFGRTPKFKPDGGREHYAEGWLAALSGAGVRGGQVIGATDKDGVKVTDRPVTVQDLFATFCEALGLDPSKEYTTAEARPVKLVEGGSAVTEVFS
jgi:uncharacterized protein (DUF1501 family)